MIFKPKARVEIFDLPKSFSNCNSFKHDLNCEVVFTFTAMLWFLLTKHSVDAAISDIVKFIYVTWLGYDLVRVFPLKHKWLRAILYSLLTMTSFILWRMYGFPLVAGLVSGQ